MDGETLRTDEGGREEKAQEERDDTGGTEGFPPKKRDERQKRKGYNSETSFSKEKEHLIREDT